MTARLDRIDLRILAILQADGRITNRALADEVSLSASACLARVQRMRDAGVIDRFVAVVSPSRLGRVLHAVLEITLTSHLIAQHKAFEAAIAKRPQITMALKVSGRFDYLISVTTRDMPELSRLSDELLEADLGISKMVTIPVLDIAKPFSGFPLDLLNDAD